MGIGKPYVAYTLRKNYLKSFLIYEPHTFLDLIFHLHVQNSFNFTEFYKIVCIVPLYCIFSKR